MAINNPLPTSRSFLQNKNQKLQDVLVNVINDLSRQYGINTSVINQSSSNSSSISNLLTQILDLEAEVALKADKSITITPSAPLSGGGDLSGNRTISISQATTSTNGYVSSTDWNTFNNKASTSYVDSAIASAVAGLMDYRGVYDASGGAYPSTGGSGTAGAILKSDFWIISVAGTLPTGLVVEAGDLVIAKQDTPGNTQANWNIVQYNIGYTPENAANKSTDGTFASNSDTLYPSQKAAKTYSDTKIAKATNVTSIDDTGIADNEIAIFDLTNKKIKTSDKVFSTDGTLAANSDSNIPTEKAIKTYADTKLTAPTWTDYSSTSTVVGWSSTTTKIIKYIQIGSNLLLVEVSITGTSNSTSTTITIPSNAVNDTNQWNRVTNNGTNAAGRATITGGSNVVTFYTTFSSGTWTASGTKTIYGQFFVEI